MPGQLLAARGVPQASPEAAGRTHSRFPVEGRGVSDREEPDRAERAGGPCKDLSLGEGGQGGVSPPWWCLSR